MISSRVSYAPTPPLSEISGRLAKVISSRLQSTYPPIKRLAAASSGRQLRKVLVAADAGRLERDVVAHVDLSGACYAIG